MKNFSNKISEIKGSSCAFEWKIDVINMQYIQYRKERKFRIYEEA